MYNLPHGIAFLFNIEFIVQSGYSQLSLRNKGIGMLWRYSGHQTDRSKTFQTKLIGD